MNPVIDAPKPPVPKAESADLSAEIILMLEKQPADRVTCRRVSADNYRCNWWAPCGTGAYDNPGMQGMLVTTHRVRQSRFVTATRTAAGLTLSFAKGRPPAR